MLAAATKVLLQAYTSARVRKFAQQTWADHTELLQHIVPAVKPWLFDSSLQPNKRKTQYSIALTVWATKHPQSSCKFVTLKNHLSLDHK